MHRTTSVARASVALLLALGWAPGARAQSGPPPQESQAPTVGTEAGAPSTWHAFGLAGGVSNVDASVTGAYRLGLAGGWQLGLDAILSRKREAYISGRELDRGTALSGAALAMIPLVQRGPLSMHLRLGAGLRRLDGEGPQAPRGTSLALTTELGPIANLAVTPGFTVRTGFVNVLNLQLDPATDVDALGQMLTFGVNKALGSSLQIHVDVETGGLFGYDGDGGKYLTRGTLGLRYVPGAAMLQGGF